MFAYGSAGDKVEGQWQLNGIQCEQCHGPGPTMEVPDGQVCRDCHSSGDFGVKMGTDPAQVGFRIAYDATLDIFSGHHGEGDEYRRSPHKDLGCNVCHDPHKSVWKDAGGVRYAEPGNEESIGMMCTHCHDKTRVRGAMGEMGMVCVDCHMPESSALGHRHTHLWRINSEPLESTENWKEEPNDSGVKRLYWKNYDGTTGAGDSFITLDMACAGCHENMSLEQMSNYAKYIHRQPGLVDLTVNGGDSLQVVKLNDKLSVDFTIYAEDEGMEGVKADTWVNYFGPKGWYSHDGSKWRAGLRAWKKNSALSDMSKNVLNSKMAKGTYTYWVQIFPTDGSDEEYVDSVPVYVKKK